jgi:hypothetical protein
MAEEKEKAVEQGKDADAEREAWAAFLAELKRDPAFQFVQGTGAGFILPVGGPVPKKPEGGDT